MRYIHKKFKLTIAWLKKRFRRLLRRMPFFTKNRLVLLTVVAVISFILVGMQSNKPIYTAELLDTIAKVESRSNYNAYYSNPNNSEIPFTTMSVEEVLAWQKKFIEQGSPSNAVGRYQFISPTLKGLVDELEIDTSAVFDEALQDKLATTLLERRGLRDYINNRISREQFAHNLSQEWAALPSVIGDNPTQSYYSKDGLNKALLSIDEIKDSISTLEEM